MTKIRCTRCNRLIKTETAQKYNNMGKVCYEKSLKQVAELQDNPTLFEVVKEMQLKLAKLEAENEQLKKEVAQLKANPGTMVQPTIAVPTANIPPSPSMTIKPVKVDKVELANNTPTNLAQDFFAVQDDLKANLAKLRQIADESITSSLGTAEVKEEDTSGLDAFMQMEQLIKIGDN